MTYPGLFSRHQPLRGKDWIRRLPAEDRAAFGSIGAEKHDHGRMGGRAVYEQKGSDHMKRIGRIGAIKTNSWKFWKRAMQEELAKEFGVTFDF